MCKPLADECLFWYFRHEFLAISKPAVQALSFGAAKAGTWLNTGEGGLSPYHLQGGADIILIPEIKYSVDGIIRKLNSMKKQDIQHSLIIVAEAVKKEDGSRVLHKYMDGEQRLGGIGDYIAQELMTKTDVECRVTSLGHVQRGAPPTASDRILASAFGVYAVDLLNQEKFDRMVAWKNRKVIDVPIDEGINTYKNVERKDSLVETALSLGIYIGDEI